MVVKIVIEEVENGVTTNVTELLFNMVQCHVKWYSIKI